MKNVVVVGLCAAIILVNALQIAAIVTGIEVEYSIIWSVITGSSVFIVVPVAAQYFMK